jgi:hypothetical protein
MRVSASVPRGNIYRLLDEVIAKQEPLQVEHKGQLLEIIPKASAGKLARLVKHDCLVGDPESIVHVDWSGKWQHDLP